MQRLVRFTLVLFSLFPGFLTFYGYAQDPGSHPPVTDSTRRAENTDSIHHPDTVNYHYSYAATGILNNTNSLQSYVLNNALKASMAARTATVNFVNSWIYGRQDATLTNNDFSSSIDVDLYKTVRHFYYWAMANYNTSVSLQISSQEQAAVGVGYNLVDKKKMSLVLSDGPLYEKGDLYDSLYGSPNGAVFQRDRYQTMRNSFRLLYHWVLKDKFTFDGVWFMQNALADWNDYILRLNGSVSVKLEKWLSFTVTAMYNEFTRTRRRNSLVNFGLTILR